MKNSIKDGENKLFYTKKTYFKSKNNISLTIIAYILCK